MDENRFFHKATMLICSSLNIEIALKRCREYVCQHIPADAMSLNIYEPDKGALRYLAHVDHSGSKKIEKPLKLPKEVRNTIESGQRLNDYLIINQPEKDPMGKIIAPTLQLQGSSFIALRLKIEGQRLGVVDLFAKGIGRYTEGHARLFSMLREPFAIAMANTLEHQEVVKLKDRLTSDNRYLNRELLSLSGDKIVGENNGLADVMTMVKQVAPLDNTVLILGETGVGKEVIANAIHRSSPRKDGPFIKVNCGAIPETLIDSELFGHEKGAFTGAVNRKRGRFERADKGTIFLDEIGELPQQAQVRLLRVLQYHEIERVGGSTNIPLDIRVIASTHRNLENMVVSGDFREDLWFRINIFPIRIPPLRQRKGDIPDLVQFFIKQKSTELGLQKSPEISPREVNQLMDYEWPGNIRELENIVERTLIQQRNETLSFSGFNLSSKEKGFPIIAERESSPPTLDQVMTAYIRKALAWTQGKVNGPDGAAAILDIHPNTLRNRMIRLGINYGRRYNRD